MTLREALERLVRVAENYSPLYEDDPFTVDAFYAEVDQARAALAESDEPEMTAPLEEAIARALHEKDCESHDSDDRNGWGRACERSAAALIAHLRNDGALRATLERLACLACNERMSGDDLTPEEERNMRSAYLGEHR